jgi:acyl-CoA thioesterase
VDETSDYGAFPLRDHLGLVLGGEEPGSGSATIEVGPEHLNPNGVVHGAVLFAMIDTAMGRAAMSVLPHGRFCASVEVQLRFIRPASAGVLHADVSVVKQGRSVLHLDGRVRDDDGRLVATAGGTFAVVDLPAQA